MTAKRRTSVRPHAKNDGWEWYAKRLAVAGGGATAAFLVLWPYARDLFDSGPLPLAARIEVDAVRNQVQKIDQADDALHKQLIDHLDQLDSSQKRFAAQQQAQLADTLTARLKNIQSAIDLAKTVYDKDPSPNNGKILETLQMQLDDLQRQIRDTAAK